MTKTACALLLFALACGDAATIESGTLAPQSEETVSALVVLSAGFAAQRQEVELPAGYDTYSASLFATLRDPEGQDPENARYDLYVEIIGERIEEDGTVTHDVLQSVGALYAVTTDTLSGWQEDAGRIVIDSKTAVPPKVEFKFAPVLAPIE